MEAIVGEHANDERVLIWDICNEPFPYTGVSYGTCRVPEQVKEIEQNEFDWLKESYEFCTSELKPKAPLGISVLQDYGLPGLERVADISDVLLVHPYYIHTQEEEEQKTLFLSILDDYCSFSRKVNKPLLATETCWPSHDDDWHVSNIKFTLSELKKRNIGWVAAKLHQGHGPGGAAGKPGEPIRADGSLRPGHEIFNDF